MIGALAVPHSIEYKVFAECWNLLLVMGEFKWFKSYNAAQMFCGEVCPLTLCICFQELPCLLLPVGWSQWRGEEVLPPAQTWGIPLPQSGLHTHTDTHIKEEHFKTNSMLHVSWKTRSSALWNYWNAIEDNVKSTNRENKYISMTNFWGDSCNYQP